MIRKSFERLTQIYSVLSFPGSQIFSSFFFFFKTFLYCVFIFNVVACAYMRLVVKTVYWHIGKDGLNIIMSAKYVPYVKVICLGLPASSLPILTSQHI